MAYDSPTQPAAETSPQISVYSLKISASTFTCCISERNLGFVSEDLATSLKVVVFLLG